MAKAIETRLARLEARLPPASERGKDSAALLEKLARLERAVLATGDLSDRPEASLAERTVRRYLRGDVTIGDALRDVSEGRWP